MKIVNLEADKKQLKVRELSVGDVYRQKRGCQEVMMVITYGSATRASVSLNTAEVVYWNGHQDQDCVRLNSKLEVSEEV